MRKRMSLVCPVVCLTVILGFNALALAGDINPPPGPVGPTMKTLVEVEPRVAVQSLPGSAIALYVISEPGSYYLTGNIIGVTGKNGITIAADDVTVDLNGFALVGISGSLNGIDVGAARVNLAIRDGTIRNWGGKGVEFSQVTNAVLRDLRIMNNGGMALHAGGSAFVEACTAARNDDGIRVGDVSIVANCIANSNGNGNGIVAGASSTITNCTSRANGDGIVGEAGSTIRGCTVDGNIGMGLRIGVGGTVTACTVTNNGADGITFASGSNAGCNISDSTVHGNGRDGIVAKSGSTIRHCTCRGNTQDGIEVTFECTVTENSCVRNNGGAGIRAVNGQNTISGNNVRDNAFGIVSAGGLSIVTGNIASGNGTNYSLHAQDSAGPIIVISPGTIAVTNPLANISQTQGG